MMYKEIIKHYEKNWDLQDPYFISLEEGTVASMAYWKEYGCKRKADEGIERINLDKIVDIVNSRTPTREDRWKNLQMMIKIFRVNECEIKK